MRLDKFFRTWGLVAWMILAAGGVLLLIVATGAIAAEPAHGIPIIALPYAVVMFADFEAPVPDEPIIDWPDGWGWSVLEFIWGIVH